MIAPTRDPPPPLFPLSSLARVQLGAGAGADPLNVGLEPRLASPVAGLLRRAI